MCVYMHRASKGFLTYNDFKAFDDERVEFDLPGNRESRGPCLIFARHADRLIEYASLRDDGRLYLSDFVNFAVAVSCLPDF